MNVQITTEIICKLIGYIIALAFMYIIKPAVAAWVEKYKMDRVKGIIEDTVKYAEQKMKNELGIEKKTVVQCAAINLAEKLHLDISIDEINTIIESYVYTKNIEEKKIGE